MPDQPHADSIYRAWRDALSTLHTGTDEEQRIAADRALHRHASSLADEPIITRADMRQRIEVALGMLDLAEDHPAFRCLRSALNRLSQEN